MELRLYLFLTRAKHKEFAKKIDLSHEHFSRIMRGKLQPSVNIAYKVEKATDGLVKWNEFIEEWKESCDNLEKNNFDPELALKKFMEKYKV